MNKTVLAINPSATLALAARAKQLLAQGVSVCNFSAGEPDFDTPDAIKESAIEALRAGKTKYTPIAGIPSLCEAISAKLKNENGLDYAPGQIITNCGAKHSLSTAFTALCNPGDEVVLPRPIWFSYQEMIRIAGGVPVFVDCPESCDFKMTAQQLRAAITPRTVAVLINSPTNPTGMIYTEDELRALAEVCVEKRVYIIADEIYERLTYDGRKHASIGATSREALALTITVNGFSKAYSMTGWRVGYAAGPQEVIKAMCTVQSHTVSPSATFAQYASVAALEKCNAESDRMREAFEARRDRIHELLNAIPGVTCIKPHGAFYVFPNISSFGLDSKTFAERLLNEEHVALVPGIAFGADANVRLSYACGMDEIEEGCRRIARFCGKLRK